MIAYRTANQTPLLFSSHPMEELKSPVEAGVPITLLQNGRCLYLLAQAATSPLGHIASSSLTRLTDAFLNIAQSAKHVLQRLRVLGILNPCFLLSLDQNVLINSHFVLLLLPCSCMATDQ